MFQPLKGIHGRSDKVEWHERDMRAVGFNPSKGFTAVLTLVLYGAKFFAQ